jgi:hypothetical protein
MGTYQGSSAGFHPRGGDIMLLGREDYCPVGTKMTRLVEVYDNREDIWRFIPMMQLESSQLFRVYESDRTPIQDAKGFITFKARSSPELAPEGLWVVYYTGVDNIGD